MRCAGLAVGGRFGGVGAPAAGPPAELAACAGAGGAAGAAGGGPDGATGSAVMMLTGGIEAADGKLYFEETGAAGVGAKTFPASASGRAPERAQFAA